MGCPVVETSALKNRGVRGGGGAIKLAEANAASHPRHTFCDKVEQALSEIEALTEGRVPGRNERWYAVKLFERDAKVLEQLNLGSHAHAVENLIRACERGRWKDDAGPLSPTL